MVSGPPRAVDGSSADALDRYIAILAALQPGEFDELRAACHDDMRFRDPFNDCAGVDRFIAVMAKMFEDIRDVRFTVGRRAAAEDFGFFSWVLLYRTREDGPDGRIEGVSEVRFDVDGLVLEHVDHWDAASQLYEGLPVIGFLLRRIRRRLEARS